MRYENQKLEGLTFDLDDNEIIGCHLVDCRIPLGGGDCRYSRTITPKVAIY